MRQRGGVAVHRSGTSTVITRDQLDQNASSTAYEIVQATLRFGSGHVGAAIIMTQRQ